MKIGIDCRLWNETGVGRYIRNLVAELVKIDNKNDYVLFINSVDANLVRSLIHDSRFMIREINIPWHSISEQMQLPTALNKENLDLVHFPYFSVPIFYNKPFVVTIHDLIVNKFNTGRASTLPLPLYYAKRLGYHAVLGSAIGRAKKIIVPSKAVRQNMIDEYPALNKNKLIVTYEGGFNNMSNVKGHMSNVVEGKYFVRVGNFYPHKNIERLVISFERFLYKDYENHDVKLVLVGKKDYFYKRVQKDIERLGIGQNVILLDKVDDNSLKELYSNSIATIVPSLSEGFSLTAVEGMSCGVPVIASDIPVHREICGDGAIYFDPGSVDDLAQKMTNVFELDPKSRGEIVKKAESQSKKFSWPQMAHETLSVYASALE